MQQKHHKRTFRFVAAAATATFVGAMLAVSATPASASDLDISAKSDNTWDPGALKSVVVGDVVTFKGLGEDEHDATGTVIPPAAAPIKSPPGAKDYEYSVTVAGTYKFLCSLHEGMNGSFTATGGGGAAPAGAAAPAPAAGAAAPAAGAAGVTHKVVTGPGNVFTPPTLAVKVGDTVAIAATASHPTKSDVFPAGAAAIPVTDTAINYKVTVPGKHTYLCIAHSGMKGSFTATGAAAPGGAAAPAAGAAAPAAGAAAPAADAAAPAGAAAGKTHKVVTGPGDVFTPPTLAVKTGDTVSITGLGSHPTQSDVFPAGAAAIANTTADITYKVTVPGKYTYLCVAHPGMKGAFTATGAAAPGGAAAPAADAPAAGDAPAGSQVSSVPVGGVQTGGGSTAAGVTNTGLMTLGFGMLMAAFMTTVASRRVARQK